MGTCVCVCENVRVRTTIAKLLDHFVQCQVSERQLETQRESVCVREHVCAFVYMYAWVLVLVCLCLCLLLDNFQYPEYTVNILVYIYINKFTYSVYYIWVGISCKHMTSMCLCVCEEEFVERCLNVLGIKGGERLLIFELNSKTNAPPHQCSCSSPAPQINGYASLRQHNSEILNVLYGLEGDTVSWSKNL